MRSPRQAALRDPRTLKKLLNACCLQLGGNSVKTKSAVFTLLKALVVAIQVCLLILCIRVQEILHLC